MAGDIFTESSSCGKRVRKPYTITKSRESWSDEDHDKFIEALHLFGRDWKKIEDYVGSKTVIQIRSHAQKYFMKIQKNGAVVHVPPPRPKRKAVRPYPQKAMNNVSVIHPTSSCVAVGLSQWDDSAMLWNTTWNGSMSSQNEYTYPYAFEDSAVSCLGSDSFSGSSTSSLPNCLGSNSFSGSSTSSLQNSYMPKQSSLLNDSHQVHCRHSFYLLIFLFLFSSQVCHFGYSTMVSLFAELPDFAEIYSFIGSVFDPDTSGHLKKLKKMNPINLKTVLILMRNLTINLSTLNFESTGNVLPVHDVNDTTEHSTGFTARNQSGYYQTNMMARN